MKQNNIITALDIGTSKICALIARVDKEGSIKLIASGLADSKGVCNGLVKDLNEVSNSISKALAEAKKIEQIEVYSVFANINGSHIKGRNNQVMFELTGMEKKVRSSDMKRAIEIAKSIPLPITEKIFQVIPCGYIVDDQDGIKNPLKMAGNRLGLKVHLITGSIPQSHNIVSSINQAGYDIRNILPEPLACSYAVLSEKEKELGVILVNIGGGTTNIIIFINGYPVHTEVIPIGGNELTRSLSSLLRTPLEAAEEIKKRYGSVLPARLKDPSPIMVPGIDRRPSKNIRLSFLSQLIIPVVKEIISKISERIKISGYKERVTSGVVITGGGTLLGGIVEMAEEILGLPVRMGLPSGIQADTSLISNPIYTTAIGLIKYSQECKKEAPGWYDKGPFGRVTGGIRDFIEEYF